MLARGNRVEFPDQPYNKRSRNIRRGITHSACQGIPASSVSFSLYPPTHPFSSKKVIASSCTFVSSSTLSIFELMRPKYEMFFLSTALFLLVALFQSSQCTDVNNDSSVIEAVGGGDSQGKASTVFAEGLASAENGQGKLPALTADGMATRARYFKSFGGNPVGDPNLNIYSFGLGKRTSRSYSINPYSFGLGKRGGNAKSYPQQIPYSFGLGKRNPAKYNFGLGKRADRFGFGLGKRNLKDDDLDQWLNDEEYSQFDDTEEEIEGKEDDSQEIMDVNKRSQLLAAGAGQQQQQAFFPSHMQSAFYGGTLMSNLAKINQRANTGFGKSRTFNQQASTHNLPNLGKRLPVYNFGLGK